MSVFEHWTILEFRYSDTQYRECNLDKLGIAFSAATFLGASDLLACETIAFTMCRSHQAYSEFLCDFLSLRSGIPSQCHGTKGDEDYQDAKEHVHPDDQGRLMSRHVL